MTVFLVETYVVKPEKHVEFMTYKKKWKKFFAKWPKKLKSHKMLAQLLGGNYGGYVEMWEFENLANCEKFFIKVMQSDYTTKLYPELSSLIVPATHSMNILNSVQ